MPKNTQLKKIAVIGSGPIKIGQAAEFDYAGTQACLSLKEAGYHVILINSNPATIMTDPETADQVFLEPLTLPSVTAILEKTRPDALLPTLGGQTGLNLAVALDDAGVLQRLHIQLLGTSLATIKQAEDRQAFKDLMLKLGQPVPASTTVHTTAAALAFADKIGYPVIVRPAYTLGGTGGGIANDATTLKSIAARGLTLSPATECLIEKSIAGFKEIEYEVMRDNVGNKIVVCNMENFDPVGIHTGDSIVFAPSQTLSDQEYQTLRDAALTIVEALKIRGGCNVQLAQDPDSAAYYVIEVNPRVSRSSALASKATGYPIAKIAAKIAVGLNLTEIANPVTKTTTAAFEPALDYVVAKIPRFPFDKFPTADAHLGTQMKATGEVMAIGTTIEEALLKALASLETDQHSLQYLVPEPALLPTALHQELTNPTDQRLLALFAALRQGATVAELADLTKITPFFLAKLAHICRLQEALATNPSATDFKLAHQYGFGLKMLTAASGQSETAVNQQLSVANAKTVYKMVDTCAGEFASDTPYFYSTAFGHENESQPLGHSVLVLGSGPIRIGQGVEFDYTTVHSVKAIQKAGYHAIVVNNNPETVSTDFSISDKLYFEPLTCDSVMHIIELEQPIGVIVQFGGQTAINLANQLAERGVPLLGTNLTEINRTEDRGKFADLLHSLSIPQAPGVAVNSLAAAHQAVQKIGYPVLVRPSFVLGGRAMAIVHQAAELTPFVKQALAVNANAPVLIDRYLNGIECEVDILGDGQNIFIPGIMEHLEGAGVHSGDSMAVYPPQRLTTEQQTQICQIATRLGEAVHCLGMMNIQLVVADQIYVIDVNPRASRTVPFMSKNTGLPLAQLATQLILGKSLAALDLPTGLLPAKDSVAVKAPVFSYNKLPGTQMVLSPEMKSTGETMGRGQTFKIALNKALQDSYQLQNWQVTAGLLTDEASLTDNLAETLRQHQIPVKIWQKSAVQLTKLATQQPLIFTTDEQDHDLLTWGLSHALPVITAVDTLLACLAVQSLPILTSAN